MPARPHDLGPDRTLFDDDYVRVLEPFHPEAEARREVGALMELLGLSLDDRILDLGCGWGRHLALLGAAGHDVTGVDLSPPLLVRARARARRLDGDPALVCCDMRRLPLADGAFDVVLNLATSLGLFLDDPPAVDALREAGRALAPGGRLLIEGMHREEVEPRFAPRDRWTLDDGTVVRARRRFDAARGVSHEVLRWRSPDGQPRTKRHSLRIRTAAELRDLLERAGLRVEAVWGDWEGSPFHPDAERILLVAGR